MPTNAVITVEIVGEDRDSGHVRLSELVEQLHALGEVLRQTEREISGQGPALYYRVVDLRHSSPARVSIEAVRPQRSATRVRPLAVVKGFRSRLNRLHRSRRFPSELEVATVEAFQRLAEPLTRHVSKLTVTTPATRGQTQALELDRNFAIKLKELLDIADQESYGSVSGWLDSVNLRQQTRFFLYPTMGQQKLRCGFSPDQLEKVRASLGEFVTVEGMLSYKPRARFPHRVRVDGIDIHERDSELPTLDDVRGIAPDITDVPSEDFVRSIRNANWD